ncbi:MAG: hypothetical protein ACRDQZ_12090 [Mycobacteriales bacterium]
MRRVRRINSLKIRFLGDKVLQQTAWAVAEQLGWETTYDAEFIALTQLQADAFVTSNRELALQASRLVKTAPVSSLRNRRAGRYRPGGTKPPDKPLAVRRRVRYPMSSRNAG